jgi:endonuclease YncB( thermonuclease family)
VFKKKIKLDGLHKVLLASLLTVLSAGTVYTVKKAPANTEKVVEVVDGDTFFIANRQPIRLYGLNAPELDYCLGQEAKAAFTKLVLNKQVELREPITDNFGRIMALVYVDGQLVNEKLLHAGLAESNRSVSSAQDVMRAANDYARANKVGIFSAQCYQITPPDSKCAIKGNKDEANKNALVYTMPQCDHYSGVIVEKFKGEQWFCTEAEAVKAGYTKSPNCKYAR